MPEPNYPASSPQLLQRGQQTLGFAEGGTEGPGAVTCPLSPPGHPRGLHPGAGNGAGGGQKGDEAVSVPARWPNWVTPGQRGDLRFNPQSPGTCRAWRAGRGGHCVLGGSGTVLPPALPSRVILGTGWGTCCLPSQPTAFWHRWVPEHQHQGVLLGEVWGGTRTQLAAPPALLIPPLSAGHLLRGERRPGLAAICSQRAAALMSPWPRPNGGSGA